MTPIRQFHGTTKDEYGASHEALRADDEVWASLGFAGLQHAEKGGLVELRHCPVCQSTIARPIEPFDAAFLVQAQAQIHAQSREAVDSAVASTQNRSLREQHRRPRVASTVAACALLFACCPAFAGRHSSGNADMLASCRDRDPSIGETGSSK